LRHLVGYVNGRAYYNISNWYRTLLAVPFLKERIIGYFEQMIGSDGAHEKDLNDIQATPLERWQLAAGFTFQFFSNLIQHDRLIRKYFVTTEQIKSEFEAIDLREQSSDQLIGYLSHFAARFMKSLSIPIVNDFFAMIFMALTKEQFKQSGVPDADKLLSKLLANQHIDSRKPVESLRALVRDLRQDSKLHAALNSLLIDPTNNETGRIGAALKANGYPEFAEKLNRHLSDYGHRSPKELIMEADTYRENPFHLLRILLESSTSGERESSNNADLEKQWAADLKTQRRGWLLKWLLNRTRKAIAYREATRLDRGLHFSFFRTLLREIGNRLVDEGVLSDSRDVFYLTLNELDEFRKGCSANGDLQGLVAYRKAQAQKWKSREQEGKLFTRGTVYANIIPGIAATWSDNVHALKGTGCSEGIVTATTRTVVDPNYQADVRGKILVSESTDPGWVFLMTISAGLVCERGSLLSHTAIIGRELGIPTIVGVKGATKYIADGSEITMNGESGEIELSAKSLNG